MNIYKKVFTAKQMLISVFIAAFIFFPAPDCSASGDDIRIADGKGDWGYPNPYHHYPRGAGYIRMSWVFDTLVWKDQKGYVPALAKSWRYNKEDASFSFKLRQGIKWHDGTPFTAEDVAFTIRYFKEHPYRWVPMDQVKGAESTGRLEVRIDLKASYAPFLAYVGGTMPIIPKHIWKHIKDPKKFNRPEAFVGTGPFRFKDFDKAKGTYLFEAFDQYYMGRPLKKRLIYIKSANPIMALLSGKADFANIRPDMADHLRKKDMIILENPRGWNKKLMINHRKAPFDDRRFRQALAYAIDRHEIIAKAHRGFGSPASFGLLSPDHEFYNPDTPTFEHDSSRAGEILESLGYRKAGNGFYEKDGTPLKVELLASNITVAGESVSDRDGEVIKSQLQESGVMVDLVSLEQATTDVKVRKWQFDLAISGHGGLLGDARFLNRMISPGVTGSINSARFGKNRELLRLLDKQVKEMDPEKRKALVYRIQEIHAMELPAIPIYYPASMSAFNPQKGIEWFYTKGGIALGIPIAQNKLSLIQRTVE